MKRYVRIVTTIGLSLVLSGLAGAGAASAQEMDHGRRPGTREVQVNKAKTLDATMIGLAGNVRG